MTEILAPAQGHLGQVAGMEQGPNGWDLTLVTPSTCGLSAAGPARSEGGQAQLPMLRRQVTGVEVRLHEGREGLQDGLAVAEGADPQVLQILMVHVYQGLQAHVVGLEHHGVALHRTLCVMSRPAGTSRKQAPTHACETRRA